MVTKNFCFKIIVLMLSFLCLDFIFRVTFGVQLSNEEMILPSIQIDWGQAMNDGTSNNELYFVYNEQDEGKNEVNNHLKQSKNVKIKDLDKDSFVLSSLWLNLSVTILLSCVLLSMILYFLFRSRKVNRKNFRDRLRAFRKHSLPLPDVVYPYKLEKEDPLALLFRRIIKGFENDKIHKDPKMSIELFAEQINSYPRYIEAATKVYANCEFYHLLHFYRINEIINALKYQESNCKNEEELLKISGYRTIEELNMHFKSFMEVDFKYYRSFLFKKIK